MTRSLSSPNRITSLSRHWCAASVSPERQHDSIRFSYMIQISGVSEAEKRETRGVEEKDLGLFFRIEGACWARRSASSGDSSP